MGNAAEDRDWFATEKEALAYVLAEGVKVSAGKFNQDKLAGELLYDGRRVSKLSVERYIRKLSGKRRSQVVPDADQLRLQREELEVRKLRAEASIKEMDEESRRREMDREWLHRTEAVALMAGLWGTMRDTLRHHARTAAPTLVHLAGGEESRLPDLFEALEELVIVRSFNEVAATGRIDAVFGDREQE